MSLFVRKFLIITGGQEQARSQTLHPLKINFRARIVFSTLNRKRISTVEISIAAPLAVSSPNTALDFNRP